MKRFSRYFIIVVFLGVLTLRSVDALPIYLSDYLGVSTKQATSSSFAPYMTVVEAAPFGGFAADTVGGWGVSSDIEFVDTGPFAKGIGAHPTTTGDTASWIDFHLDAFRSIESFDTFEAVVGIDIPSGGQDGAWFEVLLDGVSMLSQPVIDFSPESFAISVSVLESHETLSLRTSRGDYGAITFGHDGNHVAWADAKLTLSGTPGPEPVPEPATILLLISGLLMLGLIAYRNRRKRAGQVHG